MMFFKKKKVKKEYDKANYEPVLCSSICTGETTAGFRNIHTGKYRDEMLIRDPSDLEEFKEMYGIEGDLKTIY